MRTLGLALLVGLGLMASGCATARRTAVPPDAPPAPVVTPAPIPGRPAPPREPDRPDLQRGLASWYGLPHHGRKTASGERYDMNDLTAAHRSLPLGTRVRVTNLANGRSVVVRINDRGPFVDGRIIDVSRAAARELDVMGAGLFDARLEVLGDTVGPPPGGSR